MQARQSSLSSLPPPSSPPVAPHRSRDAQTPSEADEPISPTWTAPSPARTLANSSPELPPLPSFSALGTHPRTPSTAARNERTDTSYYTASWGSPYRHPPPVSGQQRQVSTNFGSDDFEEDSSTLQFGLGHLLPSRLEIQDESPNRFNLEHLIPRLEQDASPNQFTLEHLIRSRLPNLETPTKEQKRAGTTPRASSSQPTSEEWVRQFLRDRWNTETNDWWSDSSGTDGSAKDQEISLAPPPKRGHKNRSINKTLNQQDFWRHFSKDQKEALGRMMSSKYADPVPASDSRHTSGFDTALTKTENGVSQARQSPASTTGTALPHVPPRTDSLRSNGVERSISITDSQQPSRLTPDIPMPSLLSPLEPMRAQTPRVRKKLVVKGKGCVISIPRDIPRGTPGYPPKPMTEEAVTAKLQRLQKEGYDVRGFSTEALEPHNRAIWPAEVDIQTERASLGSRFEVRVAKESEWKDYQNSLLEAKLAALGVSVGGEEDIPLPLSRQASSQQHPGTVFSPPLPTSSAGSHRMARQGSIVSGNFPLGPSPGHMSRQSIASPAAFAHPRASMHMHRHSTFASPANFAHHAISPSGTWSPGGFFGSQDGRSGSPALPLSRPDLSGLISPHSPFGIRPGQQFPVPQAQKDDFLLQVQLQQHQLQTQLLQQQQQQQLLGMRPSSTLAEVPEDQDEDEEHELPPMKASGTDIAPEIAVPTPRGHRHNISENLEREAASEEYHLEEAIDKQFAEGGDFSTEPEIGADLKPSHPVVNNPWEEPHTILHQPQPHTRAHSLAKAQQPTPFAFPAAHDAREDSDGARTNLSENTNPSLEAGQVRDVVQEAPQHSKAPSQMSNSWKDNKFAFSKPASAMHSKHTSRSSVSKLNVEAKEFKFNPTASFNPGSFVTGFNFSPTNLTNDTTPAQHSDKVSSDKITSLNVTAPAFKPDAPVFKPEASSFKPTIDAPVFKPTTQLNWSKQDGLPLPTSGFDFSSPPSFKPDAPVFNPKVSPFDPTRPMPAPTTFSSKIFGNVSISASDIIKPATRSKAVPIVRPDPVQSSVPEVAEEREDESGRLMQADGREKRARRGRADGDDVPKFALQPVLPSQPLIEVDQNYNGDDDFQGVHLYETEDKENMLPTHEKSKPTPEASEVLSENGVTTLSTPGLDANSTLPREDVAGEDRTPDLSDVPTPTVEHPVPVKVEHVHKSTLSANAKPFEFRSETGSAGYDFGFHVTKPSQTQDAKILLNSPPRFESRSPATTFRPSDDGSFKTALESGRYPRHTESESVDFDNLGDASFNDIDAVMKHMNEGGSDFGVERDENSWEQSSPQRAAHEFERTDLQPSFKMRSDAPSPSPRRVYAPRIMNGSGTSNQDPFDDERAVLAYESPVHRLNNADEVPVSDWDEGLLTEGEDKIQMRSRFFDKHVDSLIGRLLQNRLGPMEQNLHSIQTAISSMSKRTARSRRSLSTNGRLDSDADDEDEDVGVDFNYRNRSPRGDRKLEKIRSIVKDALDAHQSHFMSHQTDIPASIAPEQIRDIVSDVILTHQPVTAPVEPVSADQIRSIVSETLASQAPPVTKPIDMDDIRSVVIEALANHAPQPVPEQIWPDDLKNIFTEALASYQPSTPAASTVDSVQPDAIRSIVTEALASHRPAALGAPVDLPQPQIDMSEIVQVIGSLKASIAQSTSHNLKSEDVREVVEDALERQAKTIFARQEATLVQDKDNRIAELLALVEEANARADAEARTRTTIEARESDTLKLLKVTEEELTLLQQTAKEDEHRIRALTDERDTMRRSLHNYDDMCGKISLLEAENERIKLENTVIVESKQELQQDLITATTENEALTATLEEYRLSGDKLRNDIQAAHDDSERLRQSMSQARFQAEEAIRVRETMRSKIEKLQQDMVAASQQIAVERAQWQKSEEATLTKYEILSARIEAEGRTRERLERELERLETQEREGMKLRIHLEQTQKHNASLEETINQLRNESLENQKNAERYERDMREARDAAHVEIRRTRILMEADIDAANNQVNIVRHELESEISRVRAELDQVRLDADTAKERHELDLEAASDAKKQAVHEALESNRHSLQEQQRAFERQLEHVKQEHTRAIDFIREDKARAESFHTDKLALAESKLDHFKDKIALLEEKLEVAKEAANAAAAAASKLPMATSAIPGGPEKISTQALRESIAVLQEQLQEREGRIEVLERQLEEVDTEAPAKLKERDTEINWLRELLGVRIDDLNDLINSLAQPTFNRESVRDAAIRIRTNLQMEQSEKERLISGSQQSFPSLSTLSNFASPKAVQLAAAFGNWRKGRGEAASALAGGSSGNTVRNQTPSRRVPQSANSFLSGLMTPPTSNMRRTPEIQNSSHHSGDALSNSSGSVASGETGFPGLSTKQTQPSAPRTPPLMRKTNYDQDAEMEPFSESGFYDDESTVDGEATPLALHFGRELER